MSDPGKVEAAVDYLTTTWPMDMKDTILESTSNVVAWAQGKAKQLGKGHWVKPWAWQGYVGYTLGPVSCGERPDGCILRLSNIAAHQWLQDGFTAGHNISRIDVMLTVWGVSDQTAVLTRHKGEADAYRKTLQSRPFAVRGIDGVGDGDTLYTGSRTSELFTRSYDKEREQSGDEYYKTALRYEAECKERLARVVYERCILGGYSATNCEQVCSQLFARRGIVPMGSGGLHGAAIDPVPVHESSLESTISWLEKQVAPTIRKLRREGYGDDAIEALGLSKLAHFGD